LYENKNTIYKRILIAVYLFKFLQNIRKKNDGILNSRVSFDETEENLIANQN